MVQRMHCKLKLSFLGGWWWYSEGDSRHLVVKMFFFLNMHMLKEFDLQKLSLISVKTSSKRSMLDLILISHCKYFTYCTCVLFFWLSISNQSNKLQLLSRIQIKHDCLKITNTYSDSYIQKVFWLLVYRGVPLFIKEVHIAGKFLTFQYNSCWL